MYAVCTHCKRLCERDQIIPLGEIVPFIDIIIFAVIAVLLVLRLDCTGAAMKFITVFLAWTSDPRSTGHNFAAVVGFD